MGIKVFSKSLQKNLSISPLFEFEALKYLKHICSKSITKYFGLEGFPKKPEKFLSKEKEISPNKNHKKLFLTFFSDRRKNEKLFENFFSFRKKFCQ